MDDVSYRGIRSVRAGDYLIPNLHTVALEYLYETNAQLPPESETSPNQQAIRTAYSDIWAFIEKLPMSNKPATQPSNHHQGWLPPKNKFMIFRNNNQQRSKILFFDPEQGKYQRTCIEFYRVEAACFIAQNRLALIAIIGKRKTVVIVDRIEGQLDTLHQLDIRDDKHTFYEFHCVDIRYVGLQCDKQYLVVFLGYENAPTLLLLFECSRGLVYKSKRETNSCHGRLFPVIFQQTTSFNQIPQTWFYLIGGKVKSMGSTKCYTDFQRFSLKSLLGGENQKLESSVQNLVDAKKLEYMLFGGAVSNRFLLLPLCDRVLQIQPATDRIRIVQTDYRLCESQQGKHKRYLPNEFWAAYLTSEDSTTRLQLNHVCHDKEKFVKQATLQKTLSFCMLF